MILLESDAQFARRMTRLAAADYRRTAGTAAGNPKGNANDVPDRHTSRAIGPQPDEHPHRRQAFQWPGDSHAPLLSNGRRRRGYCLAAVQVPGPAGALPHPKGGRLGLELSSLRNQLKKDIAGTLKKVREWGFEDVELAGFPSMSATDTARVLRTAGLHAVS